MAYGDEFVLTLFTDDPALAARADGAGIDRIGVDLERLGKNARQGKLSTWISDHTEVDLAALRPMLRKARLFARCNPVHEHTALEIDRLIGTGVQVLMLPFFRSVREAEVFLRAVDGRAHPVLLVETAQAAAAIADLCRLDGVRDIHIGLNDMRLSLGWPSHFHVLVSDFLVRICDVVRQAGLPLGVGGIGRVGQTGLPIPSDLVSAQMARLGATASLVSRSFFADPEPQDLRTEVQLVRVWLDACVQDPAGHAARRTQLRECVERVFGAPVPQESAPALHA